MSMAIGRRHLAVMALVTIGVTACGGRHDGGAPTGKATAGRGPARSARVSSQRQLEDAVVDARELPGVRVEGIGAGTNGIGNGVVHAARRAGTSPARCAPVSAAVGGTSGYPPVASVRRIAGRKGHSAILTLVSYRSADAAQAIDDLRAALKSCKGYTSGSMKATYEDIRATDGPPQGDDRIGFRLELAMEPGDNGLKLPTSVLVVRQGSTLAIHSAASDAPGTAASVPSDLVDAQSKALDNAVRAAP
ncbi:hypothetical protein FRZ03_01400 [Streptomyces misionensis]|uniref:PknH-like extracellular domain-containing protein n=1 Tax=Streptomyces misionensis TaxID=67331 RepID=A0A5C6K8U3_9ACTN|nr:hypothetical protein [Streptomyces misionensis]TWV58088.1 hypothetical protein FRZ03_01400 [Streptomyces misionensis]